MANNLTINTKIKLNNNVEMPIYGLGMYKCNPGEESLKAAQHALANGNYRMIDTAEMYANEADIGVAIKNCSSNIPRESIFIVSKLFQTKDGKEGCVKVFNDSLMKLDVGYIDQYLLHAPHGGRVLECYDVLLDFQKKGLLKTVGVSNFGVHHLEAIRNSGRPLPQVNQIELHPWCTNEDIVEYCREHGIGVVGYSPLTKGRKLDDEYLVQLSKKYNKTPAQILIRWSLQKGFVTIPKSARPERINENANVFDFEIDDIDMKHFDTFGKQEKYVTGWDPTKNPMSDFGPTD